MASPTPPKFHSECDVGAMVYGPADRPDGVLEGFLGTVLGSGYDAVGVVQRRHIDAGGGRGTVEFALLAREARPQAFDFEATGAKTCGTAPSQVGARLAHALKRRPDLLVLNRFGSMEAAGAGLMPILGEALEREIPVVIAVPEALFPRWLVLCDGLAVKLRPDPGSLTAWWHGLGRPGEGAAPDTFCARFK